MKFRGLKFRGVIKTFQGITGFQGFLWTELSSQLSQSEFAGWGSQVELLDLGLSLAQFHGHFLRVITCLFRMTKFNNKDGDELKK